MHLLMMELHNQSKYKPQSIWDLVILSQDFQSLKLVYVMNYLILVFITTFNTGANLY